MADGSQESAVLARLKELQDAMNSMRDDNKEIKERLEIIENPKVEASGLVREHSAHSGASEAVDEVDIFEHSEEEPCDVESETDLVANSFACDVVEGPKLGAQLADTINKGLVSQDDPKKVTQLHDSYVRPVNIPNLRVPKLNEEVIVTDHNLTKENQLISIQQNITTALCIVADILNDQSKVNHKYTREDIFNKSNEISSLLIHTHKEVSLARKHNVKDLLQSSLHGLCTKKHASASFVTNKFLFEEDLGDEVTKNAQKRQVIQKVSKNSHRGGQRPPKSMQRYPHYQGQRYKNLKAEARPRQTSRGKVTPRGDVQSRGRGRGQTQRGRGRGSRM